MLNLSIFFLSSFAPDFDEEKLQRDGGGAMTISEARQLLIRAMNQDKEEVAGNRDAMQNPYVQEHVSLPKTSNAELRLLLLSLLFF
jgi:hypothetical protein